MHGGQGGVALLVGQEAHGNAISHAVGFAPDVFLHRLPLQGAARLDEEDLILLDGAARAGENRARPGAGGEEGVARLAPQRFAIHCLEAGLQAKIAALAGFQGAIQEVGPGPRIAPAALAGDAAAIHGEGRRGIGLAQGNHIPGKAHAGAHLLVHLALGRELEHAGRFGEQGKGEQDGGEAGVRHGDSGVRGKADYSHGIGPAGRGRGPFRG